MHYLFRKIDFEKIFLQITYFSLKYFENLFAKRAYRYLLPIQLYVPTIYGVRALNENSITYSIYYIIYTGIYYI